LTIRNSELSPKQSHLPDCFCDRSMHTACVWSVKLPFAEYSVVKERFTPAAERLPAGGRR
jgi:hypothetical protein